MTALLTVVGAVLMAPFVGLLSLRIVKQREEGVLFRLARVVAVDTPGLNLTMPATSSGRCRCAW